MITDEEKKWLFLKCKKSVQEIKGWKVFIFLPQNLTWRLFITITVFMTGYLCILKCFYTIQNGVIDFIEGCCDVIYIVDAVLCIFHYAMVDTRKLRHGKKRHIFFIIMDFVSMIPLTMVYNYLIYNMSEKNPRSSTIYRINVLLRIYQLPKGFSDVKSSIYKSNTYFLLTFMEVLLYILLITNFFSCFLVLYFDENQRQKCQNELLKCILENEIVTLAILTQCFFPPLSKYPIKEYKILLIIDFIVGFLVTYGYIIPVFIFVSLRCLAGFFEYSRKWAQLKILIENVAINDKKLKRKIYKYFDYVCMYGRGDRHPEILNLFPLCFKKIIFCDLHWNAFRHSDFLQDLSIGCKRSLALHMNVEFLLPETTLIKKKELKTCFIYLESGTLQIMSEENSSNPVISFSSGTVLGESSFFLHAESVGILKAPQFSIIHVLKFQDFFRVLLDYPRDTKKVIHKFYARMQLAKSTYRNKFEINPQFSFKIQSTGSTSLENFGNIKWIKKQCHALSELRKAEKLKAKRFNKESIQMYQRRIQDLNTQLEHTSVNLSLITVNDQTTINDRTVCMTISFPWIVDPQSPFLSAWKILILFLLTFTIILYTAIIGWCSYLPWWFFNISVLISLTYIIDVILQLITGVKINNVVISKFSQIVLHRLSTLSFYFDFLAAIPLQLLIFIDKRDEKVFTWNLYFVNALLKTYRLIPVISNWSYSPKPGASFRSFLKYLLVLSILIYWSAAVFSLTDIKCAFYKCSDNDWYHILIRHINDTNSVQASFFRAVFLALDIPQNLMVTDIYPSFLISGFFFLFCRFFFFALQAECSATYVLEYSYEFEYKRLVAFIYEFMKKHKIVGNVQKRVMKTLMFQWDFDKGNYIIHNHTILDEMSKELKNEIDQKWLLLVLQKSKLFGSEDYDFQMDLCQKAVHLVLPAKSLLLTFGVQSNFLCVIEKGFVQINSFISGDLKMNVSTPMIAEEGDVFPVIDAFSQTPAAVSAIAITDCRLLMFDLEGILSIMLVHGLLKDLVEAVRETDLSPLTSAKLGLTVVKDFIHFDEKSYERIFKRLKYLGPIMKFLLKKKAIHPDSAWYIRWEWTRLVFVMLNLISWPVVFAFNINSNCSLFIFILMGLDLIFFIDFYIHLHVAYYNKKGIYITHPLSTSFHYLTSSFIPDFIAFAPNFHLLYLMNNKKFDFHWSVVVIHMIMRTFSAYRIVGFLSELSQLNKIVYRNNIMLYLWIIILGMHYYVNLLIFLYMKGIMKPIFILPEEKNLNIYKPFQYYIHEVIRTMSLVFRKVNYIGHINKNNIITSSVLGIFGILCQINLYSYLTLKSMTANKNLTTYRYLMKSFVEYLNAQKTGENIANLATEQFEYEWMKHKGYDLQEIFSRLPRTLHEDIMLPLYKKTLKGVASLSKANESFYRTLSITVREVYLKAGSEIIHEKQVQSDIFFIHKGQCYVESSSEILHKGSIIGDIRLKGIMKNTITAKTQVKLLKLSSKVFFLIINNYCSTKTDFQSEAAKNDDFIESLYVEERKSFTEILSAGKNDFKSKFVPLIQMKKEEENSYKKKKQMLINPESLKAQILELFFVIVAYVSVIFIPIFMALKFFSPSVLFIIYTLDAFWLMKILVNTRTIYIDARSGRVISSGRAVIIRYLRNFNGLIIHILSVLPIELIPLAYFGRPISEKCCFVMSLCYINRLLRLPFIYSYMFKGNEKLIVNIYKVLLGSIMSKFAIFNFCVSIDIILNSENKYDLKNCYWTVDSSVIEVLISSYFCVTDTFVGGGLFIFKPHNFHELVFRLFISFCSVILKAVLLKQALLLMYVSYHTRSDNMLKLEHLERYLSVRNISPILHYKIEKYYCDLLDTFKEGAEPTFLNAAPSSIKRVIMREIYTHHLSNCYLFQNLENFFLEQLAERLERNIFFPGDYITEKGDVDHNMYFIHQGEVYCIEEDKQYKALEIEVDLYVTGEYFGILQGVFLNYPHKKTYRAKTLTDILVLNYYKWEDMRSVFPHIAESIFKKCMQYDSNPRKKTHSSSEKEENSKYAN